MTCPKCNESKYCKDGFIKARQRYQCKNCRYRWTVNKRSTATDKATKRLALLLYLEGLGFRAIGRILGFSDVAILKEALIKSCPLPLSDKRAKLGVAKCPYSLAMTGVLRLDVDPFTTQLDATRLNQSFLNWIRDFGEKLGVLRKQTPVRVVKMDEMHSILAQKKRLLNMDCC